MILDILFCLAIATVILEIIAVVFFYLAWRIAKSGEEGCEEAVEDSTGEPPQLIVDFERCDDIQQLHFIMDEINRCQYQLISVTQDSNDIYTVFFRRCLVA